MANTGVTGKVIDEIGIGIAGLAVFVYDHDVLFADEPLGQAETDSLGAFTVSYPAGSYLLEATPDLLVRVFDRTKRLVHKSTVMENVSTPVVAWPPIPVGRADVDGWFATGSVDVLIVPRDGNAVEPLIDNETAWAALTRAVELAKSSICLMPFAYSIPEFESDPSKIVPVVVMRFGLPPEGVRTTETRLERVLLEANRRQPSVQVLALLHENLIVHDADAVESYFKAAQPNTVEVRHYKTGSPMQMTHAKIVIIDSREAFLLGSPLLQVYYNGTAHKVDDARRGRGGAPDLPVHDVSLRITGPAVRDIEKFFLLHWNAAGGGVPLDPAGAPPPAGDLTVQIVRTLPAGDFVTAQQGEGTVLEAYLRAIAHAERYIYLENQYFVNRAICEALVSRLLARPNLQLIIAMNNRADIPSYSEYTLPVPWWVYLIFPINLLLAIPVLLDFLLDARQSRRIQEIIQHLGNAAFDKQVGVFTLWTHETKEVGRPKPRIIANYIHAKVAIIDDAWMTVGSANLDDFSMKGNSEANAVVANRTTWQPIDAVAEFRRRLWSEHLGFRDPMGQPDPNHTALSGNQDWLELWRKIADRKLQGLKVDPLTPDPGRVLMFPHEGVNVPLGVQHVENYLIELGITKERLQELQLEKRITPFDFGTHAWL